MNFDNSLKIFTYTIPGNMSYSFVDHKYYNCKEISRMTGK